MSLRQDFRRFSETWKFWAAAVIPVFLLVMIVLSLFGLTGCVYRGAS